MTAAHGEHHRCRLGREFQHTMGHTSHHAQIEDGLQHAVESRHLVTQRQSQDQVLGQKAVG